MMSMSHELASFCAIRLRNPSGPPADGLSMTINLGVFARGDVHDVIGYLCRAASLAHALGNHAERDATIEILGELLAVEPERRPAG